jgi:hypothetical protein
VTAAPIANADGSTTLTITQETGFPTMPCVVNGGTEVTLKLSIMVYGTNPDAYNQPLTAYLKVTMVPTISLAASLLAKTATTATYLASVSTQSFNGAIGLGLLGTGSCTSLMGSAPSVTMPGGQWTASATVSVSTAGCAAGTNGTITITADNHVTGSGRVQADPQTVPLQTAPNAAVMTSPPPGATIPGGATVFKWSTVTGGTYSLALGSSPGGSDIYYSGLASAGTLTLPTSNTVVYATLGTQVNGAWQYQPSVYTVNPSPGTQALTVSGGPAVARVGNNGTEIQYVYYFTGGDATRVKHVTTSLSGAGVTSRIVQQTSSTVTIGLTATVGLTAQPMEVEFCDPDDPDDTDCPVIPCEQAVMAGPVPAWRAHVSGCNGGSGPENGGVEDANITVTPMTVTAGTTVTFTLSWDSDITIESASLLGSGGGTVDQTGDNSAQVTFTIGLEALGCLPNGMDVQYSYLEEDGSRTTADETTEVCIDAAPTVTISGRVTTAGGQGVAGVSIGVTGSSLFVPAPQTGSDGSYSFQVLAGGDYTLAPYLTNYTFSPLLWGINNISSNSTQNFTAIPVTTVFLIHGIGQGPSGMQSLAANLQLPPPLGVDPARFVVNSGFDFSACTQYSDPGNCPQSCTISAGAQQLATYIMNNSTTTRIILVGYSLGGLIVRDLIANNYSGVLNKRTVSAVITLGTPNLGYPFELLDGAALCSTLVLQMAGSWNPQSSGGAVLSPYLSGLASQWRSKSYGGAWMAATGRQCNNPYRMLASGLQDTAKGCRLSNVYSDGVVCADSATYNDSTALGPAPTPSLLFLDPSGNYVHTTAGSGLGTALVLCPNYSGALPLEDPPYNGTLFPQIVGTINAQ